MSRVFVIERTRHDVSSASDYGPLKYIFPPDMHRSSLWSKEFRDELTSRLDDLGFNPKVDYILAAGNTIPLIMLVGALVARFGYVRALAFYATDRTYTPILIGDESNAE